RRPQIHDGASSARSARRFMAPVCLCCRIRAAVTRTLRTRKCYKRSSSFGDGHNESARGMVEIVVADFSYLVGPRGAPFSPGGAGKRSSTLTPGSSGALDCDVLKPIHRPMKMIIIHNRSDTTAAALPASGA